MNWLKMRSAFQFGIKMDEKNVKKVTFKKNIHVFN